MNRPEMLIKLIELTRFHQNSCKLYNDYVKTAFPNSWNTLEELPYLPVRAFKNFELKSVETEDVFKVMLSSGTTGKPSKIFLSKENARSQSKELAESFKNYFGGSRFPMLVIDSERTARGYTARSAAVNGFSMYSKGRCFALDGNMNLDLENIKIFLEKHSDQTIFIFGFTFILYEYFLKVISEKKINFSLNNSFVLHGGGWKKLASLQISDENFKKIIFENTGCTRVHNYYGMIEQTGSIYFECEQGHLHAPHNGGVLIRDLNTHAVLPYGETGLIHVFSSIQESYPGHSLLTEDIGTYYPSSQCSCGRTGDIVKIFGRLKKAEIRGCSDAV